MQYFPLFVDTQSLNVLIVGAGDVASRKLDLLCRTEANIDVIAVDVCQDAQNYVDQGRITLEQRPVSDSDIAAYDLIYFCTANKQLNERLAEIAKQQGIWANVVDNPKHCRFITPSIIDRGRLQIAISTAGATPVYARELRARLESWLPHSITPLFDFIAEHRLEVQQRLPVFKNRRVFWEQFFARNAERFDDDTEGHYQSSFALQAGRGELLLIDSSTVANLLPIGAMPYLQKIDITYSKQQLPFELNELVRRDASFSQAYNDESIEQQLAAGEVCLVYDDSDEILRLSQQFPDAKYLKPGSF